MSEMIRRSSPDTTPRDTGAAMWNGFRCRCPACGDSRLFRGFLKPVETCERCGEDMSGHRSDDLPPYVTIFIVGHVLVPLILWAESSQTSWPIWLHLAIWLPLALILTFGLMQPVKGAVIGMQWGMRLHGFDPKDDNHAMPLPSAAGTDKTS
jgi:uncharacterized protein (DUF983 family)